MKDIKNIVTSLQLSRQLKEAGVKQESQFYWVINDPDWNEPPTVTRRDMLVNEPPTENVYSAFLAEEILDKLPHQIVPLNSSFYHDLHISKIWNPKVYTADYVRTWSGVHSFSQSFMKHDIQDKILANALAKLYLYLKQNNLLAEKEG